MRNAVLAVLFLPTSVIAADVIAFGDSWGAAGPHLGATLRDRGLSVSTVAIGGTTAKGWASDKPNAIADALDLNPDARWVWVSLGGNDVLGAYRDGTEATAFTDLDADLRTLVDRTAARHPNVRLVFSGYDFLNFRDRPECRDVARRWFDGMTTQQINEDVIGAIGEVQSKVAADYPHVTFVDLTGTLQVAGGGTRDATKPSPDSLMADCIHPTKEGFLALFDALDDAYWGLPEPTANIAMERTTWCQSEDLLADDSSSDSDRRIWTVDGQTEGSDSRLSWYVPRASGTADVALYASNAAWDDDTQVRVTLFEGPIADAGADAPVCLGEGHTLGSAPLAGHTYAWSPPAAVSDANAAQPEAKPGVRATYTLTVTDPNGCQDVDEVQLTPVAFPVIELSGHTWIAVGAEATVHWTVMPELTPTIDFDGGRVVSQSAEDALVIWDEVGTYVVTVSASTANGCTSEAALQVVVGVPGEEPTPPTPGDETGCGCTSTTGAPGWLLGLFAGLALFSRRRT